ncbi:MAG: flavodoxin family protein [Candidatus Methanomethylophilaceae archaeon]|nr:flavodoxin family protein [Candidatus Methanomethylophilaceae archaeon]
MKIVAFNGSPRLLGNTGGALNVVLDELEKEGVETEHVHVYEDMMNPCNNCNSCEIRGDGRCINEDDRMNEYMGMMLEADGIILGSPSYFGSCSAQLKILLERVGYVSMFYNQPLTRKVGGAVVVQDHDGGTATYNELVGWMLRNRMMVCGSSPLTILAGKGPGDFLKDKKGYEALRSLAKDMVWAIEASKGP